jgi:hypothetical protein
VTSPTDQPAKPIRGRIGFFIGLGVVAMVVVAWVWVVTPAEIRYWENRCREEGYRATSRETGGVGEDRACVAAAENLVNLGPRTAPAVLRLLRDMQTRCPTLEALVKARAKWALPVLAEVCSEMPDGSGGRFFLTNAAQDISGVDFGCGGFLSHEARNEVGTPERFLQWWEREGKAKYGGDGK